MDKSKIVTWMGILVGVVGLGLGVGWLATRPGAVPPAPVQPAPSPTVSPEPATLPAPAVPRPKAAAVASKRPVLPVQRIETTNQASSATVVTNWEDRLSEILDPEGEDTNKVQQLLALFPLLPPEGQDETAMHLSNLVEDENYAPLGQLLLDSKLPEGVLDTLLADVLNRPNETKLPMFLDLSFSPDHPKAAEARDLLELYLDLDPDKLSWQPGDKAALQAKMEEWLKENPD